MKIKQQLLITHSLLVLISLFIVFINIGIFNAMDNDATVINYSGKLRFLNYNMSQIANMINNDELGSNKAELNEILSDKISEFENILLMLEEKDNEFTDENNMEELNTINMTWNNNFKPLYLEIIERQDTKENVNLLNKEVDSYVRDINIMVTSFSEQSRAKIIRAITINAGLILLIILITIYSFNTTNNKIKKPLYLLMDEMKNLSLIDDQISEKLKSINIDEISKMSHYFNEMIYDELTKAFNRKSGLSKLSNILENAKIINADLSLCFIDVNGLKDVNDILGHQDGDKLLVSTVECIKGEIRSQDFIIRMGGDEFLIVFNGARPEIAEKVWHRIYLRYQEINDNENRPYLISVSHGIVGIDKDNNADMEALIKKADELMYIEKKHIKEELNIKVIRGVQ